MKKTIFYSFLMLLLIITGCDSDDGGTTGGGGSGGGSGGGGSTAPEIIEIIEMTVNTATRDFDQDAFVSALAAQLGIDSSRIIVLSLTEQNTAVIIELFFIESDNPADTSVDDLMDTTEDLTEFGDYTVTVVVVELDECDSAQASIQEANAMLTYVSNQVYLCDMGYDDACYSDEPEDWPFTTIYEKYETALAYGSGCAAADEAHFGMGMLSMFTATQDPLLITILESWKAWDDDEGYFDMNRDSGSRMRSGLPIGVTDFISLSNIDYKDYIPLNFVFSALNSAMYSNRDDEGTPPNMAEMQMIIEDVFIPRVTDAINNFENALNHNLIFTITPEMQNDIYTDPVEIDDAEIYAMKAFMHQLRAFLYAISTYNLDFICGDGPGDGDCDFDIASLEQNGDFLTIRDGAGNYFPNAHSDLNNILTSLQNAYDFLANAPYHENGILSWGQIQEYDAENDETMQTTLNTASSYINETQVVEMCEGGIWNEECYYYEHEYGGWEDCYWWQEDGACYDKQVSLSNFMQNPIQNWKSIFPAYTLTSGYDYDTEDDHEETTNYNFDDGCYDTVMSGGTVSDDDDGYLNDSTYLYFYPFDNIYVYDDLTINSATLDIQITGIITHYSACDGIYSNCMNENSSIGIELLDYDSWSWSEIASIGYDAMMNGNYNQECVYGNPLTDCITNVNIDITDALLQSTSELNQFELRLNPENFMYNNWIDGNASIIGTVNLNFDATLHSGTNPRLTYEYMSLDCYLGNEYDEDGNDVYGYGCNNYWNCDEEGNCPDIDSYPSEFANGEMLCRDWDGYGVIDCDCSEAETFSNQVFTNMIGDIDISDIHYVRMLYFPEGSWYMNEPHWDYDIFYLGEYLDPCLTWQADNYSSWQSGWDNLTLNGLFPDMTLNEFFGLVEISNDGWEQSSCEEDDQ